MLGQESNSLATLDAFNHAQRHSGMYPASSNDGSDEQRPIAADTGTGATRAIYYTVLITVKG